MCWEGYHNISWNWREELGMDSPKGGGQLAYGQGQSLRSLASRLGLLDSPLKGNCQCECATQCRNANQKKDGV